MKKKLLLILALFIIFPGIVLAHDPETAVEINVFYKEETEELNTLKLALKELSEDKSISDKFEVKYTKYSDSPSLAERVYLYAYVDDESLVYFVGNSFYKGFASSKYYYDNYENSLYKYEKESIKDTIDYYYTRIYDEVVLQLDSGYYDSILFNEDDTRAMGDDDVYHDSYEMDEDVKELINYLKNDLKIDKQIKKYLYIFLIIFTIYFGLKVLKKSIHKDH